jgi:sterol desaturase/sphingolipid hydroxylase (fatty acid hydroxylase superfamily)
MVLWAAETMAEFFAPFLAKINDVLIVVLPSTIVFAVIFAALTPFPSLACNASKPWWRNRGLLTDLCYCFILPFLVPYMRLALLIVGGGLIAWFVDVQKFNDAFGKGYGPLGGLPLWAQAAVYLVLSDFLMYWIHRAFHGNRMWRYHAIHHSAEDVDWTTAYRFHPINLWLDPFLVDALMLFIGIPVVALALLAPFNSVTSAYVHANLKWTLGPLKYVFASPVFHRWHHTAPDQGGDKNFGSTFALWDVLFGTFYMPAGKLPENYGVGDPNFPTTLGGQLIYPFLNQKSNGPTGVVPVSTPVSLRRQ